MATSRSMEAGRVIRALLLGLVLGWVVVKATGPDETDQRDVGPG